MRLIPLNTSVVLAALLASAVTLSAQEPPLSRPLRPSPGVNERAQLEKRMRKETEQALRDRLKLSEDQVKKLRAHETRFQPRRSEIVDELRSISEETEKEIARGDAADQKRVADFMQRTISLRKRLMELGEEQQRELLTFLTPVQTSQYTSFQKQLRDKVRQKMEDNRSPIRGRRSDGLRHPGGDRRIMPPGHPF